MGLRACGTFLRWSRCGASVRLWVSSSQRAWSPSATSPCPPRARDRRCSRNARHRARGPGGAGTPAGQGGHRGRGDARDNGATYRKYADAAYAEAIKYTPNVVKVYSPNATWSKVKSAAVGASVLIYFGHGNRLASPYTYDPKYTTKDGMGSTPTSTATASCPTTEQVLRRAVRQDARPRARTHRPAPPPLLRVGQLRAREGPARP
jgi:hypothetical protein